MSEHSRKGRERSMRAKHVAVPCSRTHHSSTQTSRSGNRLFALHDLPSHRARFVAEASQARTARGRLARHRGRCRQRRQDRRQVGGRDSRAGYKPRSGSQVRGCDSLMDPVPVQTERLRQLTRLSGDGLAECDLRYLVEVGSRVDGTDARNDSTAAVVAQARSVATPDRLTEVVLDDLLQENYELRAEGRWDRLALKESLHALHRLHRENGQLRRANRILRDENRRVREGHRP
jgi:hypothetical protein